MPSATVRSFAKLNLDLRVLHKRSLDNYHELRTIFQTINIYDTIEIAWEPSRKTQISLDDPLAIPDNLVTRAAQLTLEALKTHAKLDLKLAKRVPMGAGLGGGSSNAAAILLALPALARKPLSIETLTKIAAQLGSDVPFFLHGGTALGIGRGTELYPLPDIAAHAGLLISPNVHVSTAEAYRDLARQYETLTTATPGTDTKGFLSVVWALAGDHPTADWKSLCANDFESAVFPRHPVLERIVKQLARAGARPARMTGSGSALFGLFDNSETLDRAYTTLARKGGREGWSVTRIALISRRRYQSIWRRQLGISTTSQQTWPPQSQYSKP